MPLSRIAAKWTIPPLPRSNLLPALDRVGLRLPQPTPARIPLASWADSRLARLSSGPNGIDPEITLDSSSRGPSMQKHHEYTTLPTRRASRVRPALRSALDDLHSRQTRRRRHTRPGHERLEAEPPESGGRLQLRRWKRHCSRRRIGQRKQRDNRRHDL